MGESAGDHDAAAGIGGGVIEARERRASAAAGGTFAELSKERTARALALAASIVSSARDASATRQAAVAALDAGLHRRAAGGAVVGFSVAAAAMTRAGAVELTVTARPSIGAIAVAGAGERIRHAGVRAPSIGDRGGSGAGDEPQGTQDEGPSHASL